jgi:hypothetical protein
MLSQKVDLSRSERDCAPFMVGASGRSPDMGVRQDVPTTPASFYRPFTRSPKSQAALAFAIMRNYIEPANNFQLQLLSLTPQRETPPDDFF